MEDPKMGHTPAGELATALQCEESLKISEMLAAP